MVKGFGFRSVRFCFFLASKATSPGSPSLSYSALSALLSSPQACFNALEMAEPPSPSSMEMYGGEMAFVASHTAGSKLEGSPSINSRMQLTRVSTILIRLWVPFTSTKHLVSRAYDASPPSDDHASCSCGRYLAGSKVSGLSSRGIDAEVWSWVAALDDRDRVFFPFGLAGRAPGEEAGKSGC